MGPRGAGCLPTPVTRGGSQNGPSAEKLFFDRYNTTTEEKYHLCLPSAGPPWGPKSLGAWAPLEPPMGLKKNFEIELYISVISPWFVQPPLTPPYARNAFRYALLTPFLILPTLDQMILFSTFFCVSLKNTHLKHNILIISNHCLRSLR